MLIPMRSRWSPRARGVPCHQLASAPAKCTLCIISWSRPCYFPLCRGAHKNEQEAVHDEESNLQFAGTCDCRVVFGRLILAPVPGRTISRKSRSRPTRISSLITRPSFLERARGADAASGTSPWLFFPPVAPAVSPGADRSTHRLQAFFLVRTLMQALRSISTGQVQVSLALTAV